MIPVYRPELSGNEKTYVLECLDSTWISSLGGFIDKFEAELSRLTAIEYVMGVCNGTVALHLALHCLDIGPGDEVIVPTFTYIASVNTIAQTGAKPVFADSRPGDWLVDPEDVERKITPRTKAIMAVHLYGAVADMPALKAIADRHGLRLIEDCAEALGSTLDGVHVGNLSDVATFSFFGNKTITTGEGGAVGSNDKALAARMRKVKGQGQSLTRRYWHDELGFNYRMTNICAAIGLAQIERFDDIMTRKRRLANVYTEAFRNLGVTLQQPAEGVVSSNWLYSLLLPPDADRDKVMASMQAEGVDTRPVFYCAHHMPMYAIDQTFPVAQDIASRGISLPSFPALTDAELDQVIGALKVALR